MKHLFWAGQGRNWYRSLIVVDKGEHVEIGALDKAEEQAPLVVKK